MNNYSVKKSIAFAAGSSLQGYIEESYENLVKAFGEPDLFEGDGKVDIEWTLDILDNTTGNEHKVTVYNWKDYDGGFEASTNPKYKWHVGGYHPQAEAVVHESLLEILGVE